MIIDKSHLTNYPVFGTFIGQEIENVTTASRFFPCLVINFFLHVYFFLLAPIKFLILLIS